GGVSLPAPRNAYAPPGPARPPGQVGQGAPAAVTAAVVVLTRMPRRPLPGIAESNRAISAPRSSADRCHAGRFSSAIDERRFWAVASCAAFMIVADSMVIAVSAGAA